MIEKHSIQKLTFDIYGFKNNQKLANRLSTIVRLSLSTRIDNLFNKYSAQGYHIVITKVEIDLGYLNARNLENSLLVKLEKHLDKYLRILKSEIDYRIANNNLHYSSNELSNKTFSSVDNLNVDFSIEHLTSTKDNLKVMERSTRFMEAILYYLEFGYIPRHLHIPQENFQTIFSTLVLENQTQVLEHFGRKSDRVKAIALERLEHQINNFSKSTEKSQKNAHQITKIFGKIEKDKLEILSKTVKNIVKSKKRFSSSDQRKVLYMLSEAFDNYEDIYKLSNYVERLSPFEKQESTKLDIVTDINEILHDLPLSVKKKKYVQDLIATSSSDAKHSISDSKPKSFWLFKTEKEKFMEKMGILLDSHNKSAFEKLLKTNFVQTIASTYHVKQDSTSMLIRGLLTSILTSSNTTEDNLDFLPAHIDSVKELLNQLYSSTPSVISTSLSQLKKFETNPTKRRQLLAKLALKINKKHLNLILQSIVSYYSRLAPTLNFINQHLPELIKKDEYEFRHEFASIQLITPSNMLSQIHLLSKYTDSPNNIGNEISTFISNSLQVIRKFKPNEVIKFLKKQDPKISEMIASNQLSKRTYKQSQEILSMSVNVILDEIESLKKQQLNDKQKVEYEITTLLKEKYIPTSSKILKPKPISKLISEVSKASIEKKNLLKWFNDADILKNRLLGKLSRADYFTLLESVLPTDSYRKFRSLQDKYHYLWKTGIDDKQIQLIFLDLMKWHTVINEQNIFGFFFDSLQKYKGWTNEFHKRRVIERFEIHQEKMLVEEKDVLIEYIDKIKTLDSVDMKETRNKLSEGIPIKNAGLVLLWPFFKTLFQLTGLVDPKGEFVNIQARERATLLLQYLAVGSSVVEEPYLALNKILTGYPLEETVANEITLTEKERDISDALLLNVIRQWPSFQNSSADNLRGSFIIRDGILAYRNQQWILTVENKAYDLLLGKLPWGYSLIRLSWLPYMIKVEWN